LGPRTLVFADFAVSGPQDDITTEGAVVRFLDNL